MMRYYSPSATPATLRAILLIITIINNHFIIKPVVSQTTAPTQNPTIGPTTTGRPSVTTGLCADDYPGTTTGSCSSSSQKFEQITSFTSYDSARTGPCNCDADDDATTCASLDPANAVSCVGNQHYPYDTRAYNLGTVFGACQGTDDYTRVGLHATISFQNSADNVGIYIATDGGEKNKTVLICAYVNALLTTFDNIIIFSRRKC